MAADTAAPEHPRPLHSLLASAKRITSKTLKGSRASTTGKPWQEDAWDMFDLVGEQRFLATTLAGRMSQARLYVGKLGDDPTEEPVPTDDPTLSGILDALGDSPSGRAQLIQRLGVNLFVAGDGWLVGIPSHLFPASLRPAPSLTIETTDEGVAILPLGLPQEESLNIDDLQWRMLSVTEVSTNGSGQVVLRLGESEAEKVECSPDDLVMVRVWRPHPRRWWEADSPTRSSLPVLRELVGLTMHISAQVDSRLAGAGLLIVPQSATRALRVAAGLPEDSPDDPFTEALLEAMMTPVNDRANASALVPLVVTVPDEVCDKFNYLTFAKPLDSEARSLRDEAIRRLALGQDAPPELLLGTGGMNHWGAWLVQEDVVTTHLEPPLALICDALTTQYLWPVLADQGMNEDSAQGYVIWYDVSDLVIRPNRASDAQALHAAGVISDEAYRDATGFEESDAPGGSEDAVSPEVDLTLELIRTHPQLAAAPGIPVLLEQITAMLAGTPIPPLPAPAPQQTPPVPGGESVPTGPPSTAEAPASPPPPPIAAAPAA